MSETVSKKIQQNFIVKNLPNLFWPRNPPNRQGSVEKLQANFCTLMPRALKGLDAICGEKTALFCRTIKQQDFELRGRAGLQITPLYQPIYRSRKQWFFVHFTKSVSCFSHEWLIVPLIFKFYLTPCIFFNTFY